MKSNPVNPRKTKFYFLKCCTQITPGKIMVSCQHICSTGFSPQNYFTTTALLQVLYHQLNCQIKVHRRF